MELETTPNSITIASPTKTPMATPDYPALRPYFAWLPPNIVKLTFKCFIVGYYDRYIDVTNIYYLYVVLEYRVCHAVNHERT